VHARSTTIQAQTSSIDDGIAYIRDEVMPALQAMDGYIGLSMLVDRESGRCITTSAWDTEDTLNTSTEQAAPLRERASELFGGDVSVAKWEVAVMHRDHRSADGACVRATWVKLPTDQLDQGIEFYKSRVLPDIEELEGFCSASLLVDRSSGRSVSSVTFDSRDAMDRNRQQSTELKNARIRDVGAEELDEGEFDLALAHLRVPEMA
jgi:heme-degrading monooxygenase HmoA